MTSRPRSARPADGPVWITGASSGIGEAVALRLAKAGWTVAASARSEDKLAALAERAAGAKGRIVPVPLDVTDRDACTRAVARITTDLGPPALVILNAGSYFRDGIHGFSAESVEKSFTLNVGGVANCLEPVLPAMIERRAGQIAIVSSVAGYRGLPMAIGYGGSKAALINMAEAMKPECDRAGIKLQVIDPGFVKTPLTDKNTFPMPFLVPVAEAARKIVTGLKSSRFEIAFPTPFVAILKVLRVLPFGAYFALTGRMADRR